MRYRSLCVACAILVACTPRSPMPTPSSAERELVALEYRWAGATKRRDAATVAAILAPEWYLLGPHGNVITRDQMLAVVRSNSDRIDTTEYFDVRVHVFADAAAVTGGAREIGTRVDGRRCDEPYRWMDVFTYRAAGGRQSCPRPRYSRQGDGASQGEGRTVDHWRMEFRIAHISRRGRLRLGCRQVG